MENNIKENSKTFTESNLTLENRKTLKITGVEKVLETNENKIQLTVAGDGLIILGNSLTVKKLDVNSGLLELNGEIDELKYLKQGNNKTNFLKKIFK